MKKLTLEQALKTPNIAFDVTPKQVNEINRITNRDLPYICVAIRLDSDCDINYVTYKNEGVYPEIYLPILIEIIEEDFNIFNSQQEVWKWLAEGNKCNWAYDSKNTCIIGFKEGVIFDFSKNEIASYLEVAEYKKWTKYKEPEYIIVNGFQVPKPLTSLTDLEIIYTPGLVQSDYYDTWRCIAGFAITALDRNIAHSTKEAAITHAKALLGYQG